MSDNDNFTEIAEEIGFCLDQRLLTPSEIKSNANPYEDVETRLAFDIYKKSREPLLTENAQLREHCDQLTTKLKEQIIFAACAKKDLGAANKRITDLEEQKEQLSRELADMSYIIAEDKRRIAELEQAVQQEPVAWLDTLNGQISTYQYKDCDTPLYTAPQPAPTAVSMRKIGTVILPGLTGDEFDGEPDIELELDILDKLQEELVNDHETVYLDLLAASPAQTGDEQ